MSIDNSILYVSDLDGTLLRPTQEISSYSSKIINDLVEKGMCFSYATARSYVTSSKVTGNLRTKFPVIVYNGAFILDNENKSIMLSNFFDSREIDEIKQILIENHIQPIVYSFINGKEKFSYNLKTTNDGMKTFLQSRKDDIRENPIKTVSELYRGDIFYFTCIDSEHKLAPVNDRLKSKYNCIFQKDIYSGEHWLEILPLTANKANAILQLKDLLKCKKIISFGDGKNDIPMFNISDECYAVENAVDELKEIATGIIASNAEDGVANWLNKYADQ